MSKFKIIALFLVCSCLALCSSFDEKHLWGSYRPDLLYEYSRVGKKGMSFGIIYHSNQKLDLSQMERCPRIESSRMGATLSTSERIDKKAKGDKSCRSLPNGYETHLRYEVDEDNSALSADYKMHDGSSYLQEIIKEKREIILNIKTLKTSMGDVQDQAWSTLLSAQAAQLKRGDNPHLEVMNHSLYFYFACQEQINSKSQTQEEENSGCFSIENLQKHAVRLNIESEDGHFTVESIKSTEDFSFQFQIRTSSTQTNMRRVLQHDLLSFRDELLVNARGNILFIKAILKGTPKSIFRISYDSKPSLRHLPLDELIRQMRKAERHFLDNIQSRLLSSYQQVPKPILQISSYALSSIIGNIFCVRAQTHFQPKLADNPLHNSPICGISSQRLLGNLTPSLYNDGFTLRLLFSWDPILAELVLSSWIRHRNVQGYSYLDNQNVLKIISTSFASINMHFYSQSAPSIFIALPKFFNYRLGVATHLPENQDIKTMLNQTILFESSTSSPNSHELSKGTSLFESSTASSEPSIDESDQSIGLPELTETSHDSSESSIYQFNQAIHEQSFGSSEPFIYQSMSSPEQSFGSFEPSIYQSDQSIGSPGPSIGSSELSSSSLNSPYLSTTISDQSTVYPSFEFNSQECRERTCIFDDQQSNTLEAREGGAQQNNGEVPSKFDPLEDHKLLNLKLAREYYQFAEDIVFNLLFSPEATSDDNDGRTKQSKQSFQRGKGGISARGFKWYANEFSESYPSSGMDDLVRHKRGVEELAASVDYLAWGILATRTLASMSAEGAEVSSEFTLDEADQYNEIMNSLINLLNQDLKDPAQRIRNFKDIIRSKQELTNHQEDIYLSPITTCSNTYPFLFDAYQLRLKDILNDFNLKFILEQLQTPYGIASAISLQQNPLLIGTQELQIDQSQITKEKQAINKEKHGIPIEKQVFTKEKHDIPQAEKHDIQIEKQAEKHDIPIEKQAEKHDILIEKEAEKHDILIEKEAEKHDILIEKQAIKKEKDNIKIEQQTIKKEKDVIKKEKQVKQIQPIAYSSQKQNSSLEQDILTEENAIRKEKEKTLNQKQRGDKLSLAGCYSSGDISLIQNYLVLGKLFQLSNDSLMVNQHYTEIYSSLLENILKNFQEFYHIYEVYSKDDGVLLNKCRQIPALAVFFLILNEEYY